MWTMNPLPLSIRSATPFIVNSEAPPSTPLDRSHDFYLQLRVVVVGFRPLGLTRTFFRKLEPQAGRSRIAIPGRNIASTQPIQSARSGFLLAYSSMKGSRLGGQHSL